MSNVIMHNVRLRRSGSSAGAAAGEVRIVDVQNPSERSVYVDNLVIREDLFDLWFNDPESRTFEFWHHAADVVQVPLLWTSYGGVVEAGDMRIVTHLSAVMRGSPTYLVRDLAVPEPDDDYVETVSAAIRLEERLEETEEEPECCISSTPSYGISTVSSLDDEDMISTLENYYTQRLPNFQNVRRRDANISAISAPLSPNPPRRDYNAELARMRRYMEEVAVVMGIDLARAGDVATAATVAMGQQIAKLSPPELPEPRRDIVRRKKKSS